MRHIRKIGKILLALLMIVSATISNFANIGTKVEAATFFVDEARLYSRGTFSGTLKYNGVEIVTTYVAYLKDSNEYPAYCISPGVDGVGEQGSYNVKVEDLLNDVKIWRVITNGFPYKTASELGCLTNEEAYVATKQAVYCAIYNREASWYEAIGTKGARVKNALEMILTAARRASSGKPSSNIQINEKQSDWQLDSSWPGYISQTFDITAETAYNTYTVSLEGDYPEEIRIADVNNNLKSTFSSGERFKIAIPLTGLSKSGNFKVKVSTELATKPILYGKAPNSSLQDYALTASIYEDAEGTKTLYYSKNDTKVEILKQDNKTLAPLSGVEFRVLDSSKKPVYTNLITNSQGKITLTNLIPGKYYLEEVKTIDGYVKYDKQIEFDLDYNQTLTITVNNSPEKKTEQVSNTQKINVSQSKEEIVVKDNQENVTQIGNEKVANIINKVKNTTANEDILKEVQNQIIENSDKNANVTDTLNNLAINNKNENYNELVKKLRTIIDNENMNINKNLLDQFLSIDNKNTNLNKNIQNLIADILNENDNKNVNTQNETVNIKDNNKNESVNTQKQNANIESDNKNTNIDTQNENTKIKNNSTNANENTKNNSTNVQSNSSSNISTNTKNGATIIQNSQENINTNTKNSSININNQSSNTNIQNIQENVTAGNQNSNINIQNVQANVATNNQNNNTNISSYNGVVKLPKTGM